MARSNLTLRLTVFSRALFFSALFHVWQPVQAGNCAPSRISESAQVKYVHDGDTVHLQDGRKLRLIGINTPELARNKQPEQPFARQARLKLMALLRQSDYRIGLEYGLERKDRYQRTLAHIYLPDGLNLQQALIDAGLATAYTTPPNARHSICYRQAEDRARKARTGIWSRPEYQTKSVQSLTPDERGFRIIQGRVSRIDKHTKGINLLLGNRLRISIQNRDRVNFTPGFIESLASSRIEVRGWLHPGKGRHFMKLRHPDAITRIN